MLAVTRQISRDFVRDRDLVHVDIICRDHMPAGEALVARQDRVERARSLCLRYAAVFVTRLKPLVVSRGAKWLTRASREMRARDTSRGSGN